MRQLRIRIPAFLLAAFLAAAARVLPVTARADNSLLEKWGYQDGLGESADLEGAKAALVTTVRNRAPAVDLSAYGLGADQLAAIFDQVFFENPGLFYLENGYSYASVPSRRHPGVLVVGRVEQ